MNDKVEFVQINDANVGAVVGILRFNTTAYKGIDTLVIIDQIRDLRYSLCGFDPGHAAELEVSFCHHGLDHSRCLITFSAVQPVVELFDPSTLLNFTAEKANGAAQWLQCRSC